MINLNIDGMTKEEIMDALDRYQPVSQVIPQLYSEYNHFHKREIWDYQAALVYIMALQYNKAGARIFEIGTCWGWSAYVMTKAAPLAKIVTCTPNPNHYKLALSYLEGLPVGVVEAESQNLLANYKGPELDMIFVDGDHARIVEDLPWWNWLKVGGLMLHHDYTPKGAPRETPPVFRWLNRFGEYIGRGPDVLMIDDQKTGMAGWYKQEGDKSWPTQPPQS